MTTTKSARTGVSQSARRPEGFRSDADEAEISGRGDAVMLCEKPETLRPAFDLLASMPDDYFADGRQDLPPETREGP
jgi:antitoxin VapB